MAIQSFQLDPNAQTYSDDDIANKANAATVKISNIADDSVGDTQLTGSAAKDNLDALADTARGYIQTKPAVGEFPITAIQRDAAGLTDVEYDDVAIT